MKPQGSWNLSSRLGPRAFSNPSLVALEAKSLRASDSELLHYSQTNLMESSNDLHCDTNSIFDHPKIEVPILQNRDRFINPQSAKKEANAEVYGFVGWVTSFFAFGLYLMWAYLPDHILHELGVSYYPDKYVSHVLNYLYNSDFDFY